MDNLMLTMVDWSSHRKKLKVPIDKIGNLAKDKTLFNTIDKACSNEWAFLFLALDGFIVLRPKHENKLNYIEVMVAHCDGGNALFRYQQQIISLARMGNTAYLSFLTVRKGFDKIAPKYGWKKSGKYQQFTIWHHHL